MTINANLLKAMRALDAAIKRKPDMTDDEYIVTRARIAKRHGVQLHTSLQDRKMAFEIQAEMQAMMDEMLRRVNGGAKPGQRGGVKLGHWRARLAAFPRLPSGDARSHCVAQRIAAG